MGYFLHLLPESTKRECIEVWRTNTGMFEHGDVCKISNAMGRMRDYAVRAFAASIKQDAPIKSPSRLECVRLNGRSIRCAFASILYYNSPSNLTALEGPFSLDQDAFSTTRRS